MAPLEGMGWARSPRLLQHTHTHTSTSPSRPSLLFMYLSLRFTGWLDFITLTIICLRKVSDREKESEIKKERGQDGGMGNYIIFLSEYISLNYVTT